MKVSVIIPMYNESRIIADTAKTLSRAMQEAFDDYEILFSSDGSTDGCDEIVRSLNLPFVRVTGYEKNRGKGCAVRTAMLEAQGEILIFTDADLAYGTDVIQEAVTVLQDNPDVGLLIGSRNLGKNGYGNYGFLRRLMSRTYIRVLCLFGGFRLSDSQCGFKAFRRDAARSIFSLAEVDGFAFDFEAILLAKEQGIEIAEMSVRVLCHGDSKIHIFRDSFKMLAELRRIRKRIKKKK